MAHYDGDDEAYADEFDVSRRRRDGDASRRVFAPAFAMMIVAILSFVFLFFYFPINLYFVFNNADRQVQNQEDKVGEIIGAGVVVPLMALSSLFVAVGAFMMKNLSSRGVAMTAAVLSVIPCCSPFCVVGIPFGIWALIVLNDPVVVDGFNAGR